LIIAVLTGFIQDILLIKTGEVSEIQSCQHKGYCDVMAAVKDHLRALAGDRLFHIVNCGFQ
jgi:hypothetical protein